VYSRLTENDFRPEFEEDVLMTETEKDQIGHFKSAKAAIAGIHKRVKEMMEEVYGLTYSSFRTNRVFAI